MSTRKPKKERLAAAEVASNSNPAVASLFKLVTKEIVKAETAYDLEEYEKYFKISKCVSTGIPSLNIHLCPNTSNTQWGVPCGRLTEIAGDEDSLKTTICHKIVGNCLADNGFALWIQTEGEFDAQYAYKNYQDSGITDDFKDLPLKVANAYTIKDIFGILLPFFDGLEQMEQEFLKQYPEKDFRDYIPPVVIVIDSIGATMASVDHENLDDRTAKGGWDHRTRPGASASELHSLFKFFVNRCARFGVAWVVTNHIRQKIGGYGSPRIQAHDSAIKYYASYRLDLSHQPRTGSKYYTQLTTDITKEGRAHAIGFPLRVKVVKGRGVVTGNREIEIPYYYNYGFDYYSSLIDTMAICGIMKDTGKVYRYEPIDKVLEDQLFQPYLDKVSSRKTPVKMTESEFKVMLQNDPDQTATMELLCYRFGPNLYGDTRFSDKQTKEQIVNNLITSLEEEIGEQDE
jgi:RecA/RadA recombinase